MRVFLDANVLFAASSRGSPAERVIRLLIQQAEVVTCDYAVIEARRNLELKWPTKASNLPPLLALMQIIPAVIFPLPVKLAEKDAPILCTAIRAQCSHLTTGDKRDFGHLYNKFVEGVEVVTLLRLTELLLGLK